MHQNEIEGFSIVISVLGVTFAAVILAYVFGACHKKRTMSQPPPLLPTHTTTTTEGLQEFTRRLSSHISHSVTALSVLLTPTPQSVGAQQIVNHAGDNTVPSYNTTPRPSEFPLAYHEASGRYSGVDPPPYAPPAPAKMSQFSANDDEMPEVYQQMFRVRGENDHSLRQ